MLFLQLSKLFFSSSQVCLSSSSILFGRHVVENDDVALLKMETVQVIQCILGLARWCEQDSNSHDKAKTHIHHIVEHHKSGTLGLLFVSYSYLANTAITSKKVI